MEDPLGNDDFRDFFMESDVPTEEISQHVRLLENCLAMGSATRPKMGKGTIWNDWFGSKTTPSGVGSDRCRILFHI